jgi:hypothetical protein
MRKNYFRYSKYGMRDADYSRMLADQKGVCAICKNPPSKGKRLVIDHDHESGEVRSLLCGKCNPLLGFANDNPEILRRAAEYLENGGHPSRFFVEGGRLIAISGSDEGE